MDVVTYALCKKNSLPPVSSTDNGKVLAVENGAWAAANNLFLVTVENNAADKTFADTLSAINAGKAVILSRSNITYNFIYCDSSTIVFARANKVGNNNIYEEVKFNSNGTVGTNQRYYLPSVNGANDKGKELVVASTGFWAAQAKKFIITLTPTGLDFSGTMDKAPAEITAAYNAGQDIWFSMDNGVGQVYEAPCNQIIHTTDEYPNFGTQLVVDGLGVVCLTTYTDSSSYYSTIYPLTPAS